MLTSAEINAIAGDVKAAQDQGLELAQITSKYPGFDAPSAYAVADAIHAIRLADGASTVGR